MDISADTPQEPKVAAPTIAAPAQFDAYEVGASLREARLALKRELSEAANDLRIRQTYLQAIEEGRLSDLPGPAYTIGFLRAYGDYLGLNGREIVDRFKAAGAVSTGPTDLHLPSPVEEGRLPTGSVLLLAALLAVGAYGGWYYMASTEPQTAETVPALPQTLADLVDKETLGGGQAGENASGGDVAGTAAASGSLQGAVDDGTVIAPPIRNVQRQRSLELEGFGSTTQDGPSQPVNAMPEPAPAPADSTAETAPDRSSSRVSDGVAVTGMGPDPTRSGSAGETMAAATPHGAGLQPAGGTAEAVERVKAAARIVLQATTDSWLEVRVAGAAPIYSGLLREGDSYHVPEQPGLTLMTGNAGGIEILVDGKAIPKLGPPGAVKRDVVLDADRLLGQLR